MKSYYVYILRCSDGSYYTGLTDDLAKCLSEHQHGLITGCHSHDNRPVRLVYAEEFPDMDGAISREKKIRGWIRKKGDLSFTDKYS